MNLVEIPMALFAMVQMGFNEAQPDESAKPKTEIGTAVPVIDARRLAETVLLQRRSPL
jgi:hypothetical protein